MGQFVFVIRSRIKLPPERAIFLYVNNLLPSTGEVERVWVTVVERSAALRRVG